MLINTDNKLDNLQYFIFFTHKICCGYTLVLAVHTLQNLTTCPSNTNNSRGAHSSLPYQTVLILSSLYTITEWNVWSTVGNVDLGFSTFSNVFYCSISLVYFFWIYIYCLNCKRTHTSPTVQMKWNREIWFRVRGWLT